MNFKNSLKVLLICLLSIHYSCNDDDSIAALSSENRILSFTLTKDSYSKEFSIAENTIEGIVASDIELEGINLDITISENAAITPNPNTITSITGPFTFTVTAENGAKRVYNISIDRELNTDNLILEFRIDTETFSTLATIDHENGSIHQKLPEIIDLTNLNVSVTLSQDATLSPDTDNLSDFSTPVSLIVTSESGLQKTYNVDISHMVENFIQSCDEMNVSKWFGGDNRTDAPGIEPYDRNVGTGQLIILEQDLYPSVFSIHLGTGFIFRDDDTPFYEPVELKLNIRNTEGEIVTTTTTDVAASFNGGFIDFDLTNQGLLLEDNTPYIFQWYLVNGALLGVMASSSANSDITQTGFCFNGGFTGQSKISENTTLEDSETWHEHSWNFNIQLEGKQ